MRKLYLLMALVITAIIAVNVIVLYIIFTRPSTEQIQHMIDVSIKPTSQIDSSKLAEIAKLVPTPSPAPIPSPIPGPKGNTVVGKTGAPGAAGQSIAGPPGESIVGPIGPKGDSIIGPPGLPGREIELSRDPVTGDMFMRYAGDTTWQLIDAP